VTIEPDGEVLLPTDVGGAVDYFVAVEVLREAPANLPLGAYHAATLTFTVDTNDVAFSNGPLPLAAR